MSTLEDLVSTLENDLNDEFESKLRAELATKNSAWLVEALVQEILKDRHLRGLPQRQLSRQAQHVEPLAARKARLGRIRSLGLDATKLRATVKKYRSLDRQALVAQGYLVDPPHKGKAAIVGDQRSKAGEVLLHEANDLFYALLYCDAKLGVDLPRGHRDFLTVTIPSAKADTLERFMLAVTETRATGTWLDPEGVSDDIEARNTILQVEFGDAPDKSISDALLAALRMINNLEVNEEILYARIEQLERSTLVS